MNYRIFFLILIIMPTSLIPYINADSPVIVFDPVSNTLIEGVVKITGRVENISTDNLIFIEIKDPLGEKVEDRLATIYPNGYFEMKISISKFIHPGRYDLKATAIIDGEKIIGNGIFYMSSESLALYKENKNNEGGGCLIATATFGSELAPQVQQLRELRDNIILNTDVGTSFMTRFNQFYYSFSPTIADWERQNPVFKETVKLAITPLITSFSILNYVDMDSEEAVLGYGIGIIIMNVGIYFVAPVLVVIRIFKR